MDISKLLLLCILCILTFLFINKCINNEFLTNDLPDNSIVALGEDNLLIPTSNQVYNPHDHNRPNNSASHQETTISNNNVNTDLVNTGIDIPIVYSHDELTDTTIIKINPPSYTAHIIDTGSGDINPEVEVNNNALNNLRSLE
jgi:hypothetical protein